MQLLPSVKEGSKKIQACQAKKNVERTEYREQRLVKTKQRPCVKLLNQTHIQAYLLKNGRCKAQSLASPTAEEKVVCRNKMKQ